MLSQLSYTPVFAITIARTIRTDVPQSISTGADFAHPFGEASSGKTTNITADDHRQRKFGEVGVPELESGTSSLSATRSNQLSYTPVEGVLFYSEKPDFASGSGAALLSFLI